MSEEKTEHVINMRFQVADTEEVEKKINIMKTKLQELEKAANDVNYAIFHMNTSLRALGVMTKKKV